MVLINRIVIKVPVAMCFVRTPMLTGFVEVLCLEDPICELIIGNVLGIQDDRACDVTVGDEAGKEDDVHDESRHEIASEDDEGSARHRMSRWKVDPRVLKRCCRCYRLTLLVRLQLECGG